MKTYEVKFIFKHIEAKSKKDAVSLVAACLKKNMILADKVEVKKQLKKAQG